MPSKWFRWAWRGLIAVGVALEIWAVKDREKGDTLTEQIRPILKHPVLWWVGVGLSIWAFRHFFFNKD